MRQLWIDGKAVDGGGKPVEVIDPATEAVIGQAAQGTADDVNQAVAAARKALAAWRRMPAPERTALLHEVARRLRRASEQIALELTHETGRTLIKNRGYVSFAAETFDYYAEMARHLRGRVIPSPEASQLSLVIKAPLGVAACIVPWNYPLLLLSWKLAPALASGNTVVVKPASYTPWTTLGLAAIFDHLPPGVLNIVAGSGRQVGEALITHPDVAMIAFTGSTEVGQHIMRAAADDVKRLNLELGGKDPLIVCADADLEAASRACAWGAFLNAGQICTSIERVYIEAPVFDEFSRLVVDLTKRLIVGPGIDPNTEVTPMIRPAERQKVIDQVAQAQAGGAQLLAGGRIPAQPPQGYYYEPTVISSPAADADLLQEETFGPVCPLIKVADFEEAMLLSNRSTYGLGATLFTDNPRKVKRYMDEIEAGNVWINDPLIDNLAGPFGGFKRSGLGRELGVEGFEAFTETKHIHWEIEGGIKSWWYPLGAASSDSEPLTPHP
jgi:acyl-CoA reductase-like NAD-dependent aldehyde dehydrogenase